MDNNKKVIPKPQGKTLRHLLKPKPQKPQNRE